MQNVLDQYSKSKSPNLMAGPEPYTPIIQSSHYVPIVWLMMLINQCVMQVALFNFLIAIVTESYNNVMAEQEINMFGHKSDLNNEFFLTYSFFYGLFFSTDTMRKN